jgi:hypothetical protein
MTFQRHLNFKGKLLIFLYTAKHYPPQKFNKTSTLQGADMEYNDRNFIIFPTSELSKVDFSQVLETSAETVRRSVDGSKTFVKWDGEQPEFVSTLENTEGPYTYEEILEILNGLEWTAPMEEM